ncbi:MAG: SDR family oxidoreductase [Puniceicoccaceae bacterium]|nr:MAG: SDR family oxidoreductase [Puniceicoccaceae bacterium]
MFRLDGKSALVTGAASGIGEAIARSLARQGARVLVTDSDTAAGEAVAASIGRDGGAARFLHLDVADDPSCEEACAALEAGESPPDILVNNAGIGAVGTLLETEALTMDALWQVNVMGGFRLTRRFLPGMIARRSGSVIFIASIGGVVAVRDRFAYTTTKFAVVGMVKALALDHSATGVRFNAVCPCRVETPFVQRRLAESADPAAAEREMRGTQLTGRMARPEEVAAGVVYLASDEAAMVTGSTLMIDSGWSAGK